jgi:hypothetical protein
VREPSIIACLQEMALDQLEQYLGGLPSNDLKDQDLNYYLISLYL